ncbi:MAG TPA: AAA family ATPase [Sphingomonadaceae bacterium]|nr:AAA family ATPase [Sphingomonadaceae bacterium]
MTGTVPPAGDDGVAVAAWLESGAALGGGGPVKRIDTHAASIFLVGDRAWKIKRPVRLGYLDFSTVEARGEVLRAELRLNRRTAPDLYIAVHAITCDDGRLTLDGAGETIDWVLEMRRFPDDALLAHRADRALLDEPLLRALADGIVDFHARAEVRRGGGAKRIADVVVGNAASMAAVGDILAPEAAAVLCRRQRDLLERHAGLLDRRASAGRVRHVHGDLHLGNIAVIGGVPTPFDCLEFDAELATIDVLYDLAFLLMDLWARDLRAEANILFNRYLDRSADDEDGGVLVPLFMSIRATVRAHVVAARARLTGDGDAPAEARGYLTLAMRLIEPKPARLVAVGGLSGTGKSTLARAIGGLLGPAPGARILRSDVLRKRGANVPIETALPPDAYTAGASESVYAELGRLAGRAIAAGQTVVADAVFGAPAERAAIERVADGVGVRFDGVWLFLPEADRIRRITGRGPDASDATAAVARQQSRTIAMPEGGWITLSAGGDRGDLARAAIERLHAADR